MLKLLIICSALATAYGQTTGAPLLPLPYAINFNQNYQLSWGFNNDTLTIQMEVVTKGWVSLAVMNDAGNMFDVWWGGYDEDYGTAYGQDAYAAFTNLTVGPRYPDTFWNLNVLNVAQSPFGGTTRVRVSRPFVSPDFKQDVDIPYNTRQLFLWAYSDTDIASSEAVASGSAQLVLRPAV